MGVSVGWGQSAEKYLIAKPAIHAVEIGWSGTPSNSVELELVDATGSRCDPLVYPPAPPVHPDVGRQLTLRLLVIMKTVIQPVFAIIFDMFTYPVTVRSATNSPHFNFLSVMMFNDWKKKSPDGMVAEI